MISFYTGYRNLFVLFLSCWSTSLAWKCDTTNAWKSGPPLKQSRITKMPTFMRLEGHSLAFRGNKGQVFRRWQGKVLDISVAGLTRKFLQINVFSHEIFVRHKPTVSCNCSCFSLDLFGVGFHVSRCRHTIRIQNVVNLLEQNRHSSFFRNTQSW